jgi:phospho-N-acetylmuramoyl-pentapeptide-transferase
MRLAILIGLITFLAVVPCGAPFVRWLRERGIGKRIRVDGPRSHQVKMGTPTMGGLLFLAAIILFALIARLLGVNIHWLPIVALLAYALLGAVDDAQGLTRDRNAPLAEQIGILGRYMLLLQSVIALAIAALLYGTLGQQSVIVPWSKQTVSLGFWYIPLAAFVIVSMANAVNVTDGLDGLAGGTSVIAFGVYAIIVHLQGRDDLATLCLIACGALLAFLWYNAHPAQVFMGGVGSLSLGGLLAVIALMSGQWLLLPLVGIIFVTNIVAVILQVGYFKYTRRRFGEGRRLFKMAPLHHHFEKLGWSEVQVVHRFWIVAIISGLIALVLAL